ncbi:hypothetical protein OEB99_12705 [Actinotalea sp. M2MS4P-6]|uniref:hypothetical protein n=1 Tax=Actinotalea sp. M2MS4P-6 TaxID=2983762 RepID=UPI0021E3C36F|nr:hypothetical protein [Actinotalea sp. M2MS4P-6]MCV2395170.1 hypothetical protein [Actinotalea sp. M2MS4P-6]
MRIDANGCVDIELGSGEPRWVVWPAASQAGAADDGSQVVLDGRPLVDGDKIQGTGLVTDATSLPGWGDSDGGYFGELGRYCGADSSGVVVFDEVALAG